MEKNYFKYLRVMCSGYDFIMVRCFVGVKVAKEKTEDDVKRVSMDVGEVENN